MAKSKLLIVDCETGGLEPTLDSILSIAALVWNNGAIEDEYYTLIAEHNIVASEGALKVNGLTVEQVKRDGVGALAAVFSIEAMLDKHDMRRDVRVCAHNAPFDMGFLKRLYAQAGKKFSSRFSYRALCTQAGALLLEQAGQVNLPGGSASLDALVKYWGLTLDRTDGHNALADAHACAAVLKRELKFLGGV